MMSKKNPVKLVWFYRSETTGGENTQGLKENQCLEATVQSKSTTGQTLTTFPNTGTSKSPTQNQ